MMCWKRYTDFRELHAALTRRFPHSGIPELPPKAMGRVFEESYLRGKQSALNAYLTTLTRIDEVSSSEEFLDFLTDRLGGASDFMGSSEGSQKYAGSDDGPSFGATGEGGGVVGPGAPSETLGTGNSDGKNNDNDFSISAVRFILQARDKTTVRVGAGKTHEVVSLHSVTLFLSSHIRWN